MVMKMKLRCALAAIITFVTALGAAAQAYRTDVKPSGTLPVLYVNVIDEDGDFDDEIIDINLGHKEYFEAVYWLDINGCRWMEELGFESVGSAENPLPTEIKARGNYTRTHFCKKPFKLKLGKKQNMLGLTEAKSKHYALLAHADDSKGFLRNFTGFAISHRMGLKWTPNQQPVELVINGDYRGLYFLTESVRVGEGRIEIEELADLEEDPGLISGGYICELDNHPEDDCIRFMEKTNLWFDRPEQMAVSFESPEIYSDIQKKFVSEQFNEMNDLIGDNDDDLWSYMDLDDAVRYYLVNELASHREAYRGSTYLYRDRGENQKWHFAPVWDFGHGFDSGTSNFFYHDQMFHNVWVASLCNNKKFSDKVKATWKWFMSNKFDGIYKEMDLHSQHIAKAAVQDWARWQNVPRPNYPDSRDLQNNSDIDRKNRKAQEQMAAKITWLASQWGGYSVAKPSAEPAADTTPAAELPDYAKPSQESGVVEIYSAEPDGNSEYFTLQGMRANRLEPGGVYIRVTGDKAEKIICK